ncbi:copper chaperone PCu(A)C [Pasteurella sp. P03HT]
MTYLGKLVVVCTALIPTMLFAQITVDHPVIFSAKKGEPTAIFMQLHNHGDQEVNLAIVQSPVPSRLALHGTQQGKMLDVTGIPIPAQRTTELTRGGWHIMVFDLEQSLAVGDSYPLHLFFDNGEVINVNAKVISP